MAVKIEDFGKDHWSLLAYIECICVDGKKGVGEIDFAKMRINRQSESHCPLPVGARSHVGAWEEDYGTRLDGYWKENDTTDKTRRLPQHDDWDCLEDLEEAGLVEILSTINGFVKMTDGGMMIAAFLRKHKADGGNFAGFAAVFRGLKIAVE